MFIVFVCRGVTSPAHQPTHNYIANKVSENPLLCRPLTWRLMALTLKLLIFGLPLSIVVAINCCLM